MGIWPVLLWLGFSIFFLAHARRADFFKITPSLIDIPLQLLLSSFLLYFTLSLLLSLAHSFFHISGDILQLVFSVLMTFSLLLLSFFQMPRKTFGQMFSVQDGCWKNLARGIAAWFVIFPFIFLLSQILDSLLSNAFKIKQLPEQLAVEYFKNTLHSPFKLTIALINTLIFAPFIEEYLFRGLFFNFLKNHLSWIQAIFLSSLIFAVFHFAPSQKAANITIVSCLFVFSLALSFLYEKYKTLLAPIALHAAFNFLSILNLLFWAK